VSGSSTAPAQSLGYIPPATQRRNVEVQEMVGEGVEVIIGVSCDPQLTDTLVRVSHLAMHLDGHLAELDINPLTVLPSGQGVKAVDALVVVRGT
jgi:hypothetical protein